MQQEDPFIDFFIPINPPIRVSMVFAGKTSLLSDEDNQMFLVKLENLREFYRTNIYVVDKVMGQMYAVKQNAATKIGLQAYVDEEPTVLEGAVGFTPKETSTPKDANLAGISSRPSDLSTIAEKTEIGSQLTRADILEYRRHMKETPSISSAEEPSQEISTQEVDKAYKKKNACAQRLMTIYCNWNIEKELVQMDLERQCVDEFYEEYKKKYTRKLEGWQDVIDMYADQEFQKI